MRKKAAEQRSQKRIPLLNHIKTKEDARAFADEQGWFKKVDFEERKGGHSLHGNSRGRGGGCCGVDLGEDGWYD
jgi:hypothetical protein